jgi:RNA polymerase sigma factor (TIGR02999 family)
MESGGHVTRILSRLSGGDRQAVDELLPLVYAELRSIAGGYMRHERRGHTLQPTALTHEAYLRLVGSDSVEWRDRAHFLGVAAQAMRRILVEHARARGRMKRGGEYRRVSLVEIAGPSGVSPIDLLALDAALTKLATADPRKARVVELLYFGGLTADEAGELLDVTGRTVERDWRYARLWLLRELAETSGLGAAGEADAGPAS